MVYTAYGKAAVRGSKTAAWTRNDSPARHHHPDGGRRPGHPCALAGNATVSKGPRLPLPVQNVQKNPARGLHPSCRTKIILSADDFTRDIQDRGDFRDYSGMVLDAQRVMMGRASHDPLLDERPGIWREEAAGVGVAGTIVRSTGDGMTMRCLMSN